MAALDLDNIYRYHEPFGDQVTRYTVVREMAKALAEYIQDACPDSRERALAMTNLEQAVMWANASIARNEVPPPMTEDGLGPAYGDPLGAVS